MCFFNDMKTFWVRLDLIYVCMYVLNSQTFDKIVSARKTNSKTYKWKLI